MTTLFNSATPSVTDAADGAPGLSLGTRIRCNVDCTITRLGWRFPDTLPGGTVQWILYRFDSASDASAGTVDSGSFSSPVAGEWNWVDLDPTELATAEDEYVAVVWTPDRYAATLNYFDSDVDVGDLTGPADDPAPAPILRNGRFNAGGTLTFPQTGSNATAYFVDIEVTTDAPDAIAVSAATVSARRTSTAVLSARRTSSPTVSAGRSSTSTVSGG